VERLEYQGMLENETPEPEGHDEHHDTHAGRDAEQAGQASEDACLRARRGQHDVARTRRDGGHDGEEKKGHDLFRRRTLPSTDREASPGPRARMRAMRLKETRSAGEGLERSCQGTVAGWLVSSRPAGGVELFSAWFAGKAYQKHRHDTYAIGVTDSGVQVFDYRGSVHASTPGQVVVLYPDEVHDGRAGTDEGFGYRIVYVEPFLITDAVRTLRGRPYPLPFVSEPVSTNAMLSRAIDAAFRAPLESLAVDSFIVDLAQGLMAGERGGARSVISRRVDVRAVERARQFLDAERTRVVHSRELESVTGLTRYDLSRQFRIMFGTSPYRYLLMRRLEFARERIHRGRPLVEVAFDAGFADQAHFTRAFRSAFGLTPARYRALRASQRSSAALASD
jgi:AraC-like DNA-binding protein